MAAIRLEMLPARLGDCMLIECARDGASPWRMLVDGGPPDTWPVLRQRLAELDAADSFIDVAVVTHIDSDHIGGMLPLLASKYAGRVGDYWFNGRSHLPDLTPAPGGSGKRSIPEGEDLVAALLHHASGTALPWNKAFGGGPIVTPDQAGFVEISTDGPRVTVLSPTVRRLAILGAKWHRSIADATRGPGVETPDVLTPLTHLDAIAAERTAKDNSASNGSSIALLLENQGASVVLGADAFGSVLGAALKGVADARGLGNLAVDAFKLPHHGSKGNVLAAMVKAAPAEHYLVSTNGDVFHHPDDAALARVVLNAPTGARVWFNYTTARTLRWSDSQLQEQYGFATTFPDPPGSGIVLDLPAKP